MSARRYVIFFVWAALFGCGGGSAVDGGGRADSGARGRDSGRTTGDSGGSHQDGGGNTEDAGEPAVDRTPFVYVGLTSGDLVVMALDPADGTLRETSRTDTGDFPSFIDASPDGRFLYVVHENSREAAALTVTPGTGAVSVLNRSSTMGDAPTHVAVSGDGRFVFAANYNSGSVATFPVSSDGRLGDATVLSPGSQAHQVVVDRESAHLYVPCKGSDRVAQYAIGPTGLTPLSPASVAVAEDSGPRHMVIGSTGAFAYVIHELDSTLTVHPRMGDGTIGAEVQNVSTLPSGAGSNTTAELVLHPNGRFLYGSNRGHDSVAIFRIETEGRVALVDHEPTLGDHPRSMALTPDGAFLIVANQDSRDVQVFSVNSGSGALTHRSSIDTDANAFYVGVFAIPDV